MFKKVLAVFVCAVALLPMWQVGHALLTQFQQREFFAIAIGAVITWNSLVLTGYLVKAVWRKEGMLLIPISFEALMVIIAAMTEAVTLYILKSKSAEALSPIIVAFTLAAALRMAKTFVAAEASPTGIYEWLKFVIPISRVVQLIEPLISLLFGSEPDQDHETAARFSRVLAGLMAPALVLLVIFGGISVLREYASMNDVFGAVVTGALIVGTAGSALGSMLLARRFTLPVVLEFDLWDPSSFKHISEQAVVLTLVISATWLAVRIRDSSVESVDFLFALFALGTVAFSILSDSVAFSDEQPRLS